MRSARKRGLLRAMLHARHGLAAMEFALILPVMIACLLATMDLALATITSRRLQTAVQASAEIASELAVQQNSTNTLTPLQVALASDSIFGIFPGWKPIVIGATPFFALTVSAVGFTATPYGCTTSCTYTAQLAWSVANQYGSVELRPCGALTSIGNTNQVFSETTLPAGTFGATSLLVADVDYTYKPIFFGFVMGNIRMQRSAYVPPRIGNGIFYAGLQSASSNVCPANASQ